jgi:antitoxin (DNA-binding transcriptional repressor) of toxin-antitoxin stability system
MKTATVRDLRNSFARISRWLEAGESVEVTKRGKVFARIFPVDPPKRPRGPKPDIMARLKEDFGEVVMPDRVMDNVRRDANASYLERFP